MSQLHEFWIDTNGQLMLDDRPLLGVKSYKMWSEAFEDATVAHLTVELRVDVAGPTRIHKSLEIAFREAMEALGE